MSADDLAFPYQLPSAPLREALEASRRQSFVLSPQKDHWVVTEYRILLTLDDLAEDEVRLAGLRFHPGRRCCNRDLYYHGLAFQDLEGPPRPVLGLPPQPNLRNLTWSPDGEHLAFTHCADELELWVAQRSSGQARRLWSGSLNQVHGGPCLRWLRDSSGLLVQVVPADLGAPPAPPRRPSGPVVQEHQQGKAPTRTYQDLLKNRYDEELFQYYLQSQLWRVGLDGSARALTETLWLTQFSLSPEGSWLLLKELQRPFSYQVPWSRFPCRTTLRDFQGQVHRVVAELPLDETILPDFDAVRPGRRFVSWREDQPATVVWLQAEDGGDPHRPAEIRDSFWQCPLDGEEERIFATPARLEALYWSEQGRAILQDGWWKSRQRTLWKLQDGGQQVLLTYSSEDDYANPGRPLTFADERGCQLLVVNEEGDFYMAGQGHSPEGERPFLDRWSWQGEKRDRIFQSQAPHYESVVGLLDVRSERFLTQRESVHQPPNLVLRQLHQPERVLTDFAPPVPALGQVRRELMRYRREDGVELSATLFLPPGFEAGRDQPLPLLMWAYPSEYKSAARAGQLRDSPFRYIYPSWAGPVFFALLGYAVLDDPTFPIVGEGEQEPNDTYVEQLLASAQAAIDCVAEAGVADRQRVAMGGHSYGAFTTANLLAHSRLLRCGIARSGAYNRTLTPFGFQSEERTFWQASQAYLAMSPFGQADRIRDPLLLIHGADDSNSGTHAMQSERLYQALKGLGGTARLVMLPLEDHSYRAIESVGHVLWEMEQWLQRFLGVNS